MDFLAIETGEPRRGPRAVIKTTICHPHRGSHPPRNGGPRSLSGVVYHHTSREKARGRQAEQTKLRHRPPGVVISMTDRGCVPHLEEVDPSPK